MFQCQSPRQHFLDLESIVANRDVICQRVLRDEDDSYHISKGDPLELNLPVSLFRHWEIFYIPSVMCRIDAAENDFAPILIRRPNAERENRLVE